jgi:hypothetical protein
MFRAANHGAAVGGDFRSIAWDRVRVVCCMNADHRHVMTCERRMLLPLMGTTEQKNTKQTSPPDAHSQLPHTVVNHGIGTLAAFSTWTIGARLDSVRDVRDQRLGSSFHLQR